ncbi:MAG: ankyrin repeat domain-containing protein [Chitinophagaceae bacterium]|nr:ankyrin repeat domain-containing protein [Chitinophagaceae bacterium]
MDYLEKIIGDIEIHDVDGIVECFENGVDPNGLFRNEPLINELTSEYGRTKRFKECVRAFVDHGLKFDDKVLLAVLLDDATSLEQSILIDSTAVNKKYTLRSAFTPLRDATLLHICAEFNHLSCAEVLVRHDADVNAQAGVDEFGFGGQTPVFHTVNQILNNSFEMLKYLLSLKVDLHITIKGLIWGKGYDWETFIPSVNPVSYAMMGLLPQMHRNEKITAQVVKLLLREAYGIDYTPTNVPNKYLNG